MNKETFKKNSSGYDDPTAGAALSKVDEEVARFNKLLRVIFYICDMAGFHIEGRIVMRDKKTGKVWK